MIVFKNQEKTLKNQEIKQFEEEFDFNLPKSYKEHMLKCNGGKPTLEMYNGLRVHYFHAIKYGDYTLEEVINDIGDVLPDHFFPFAEDAGGNEIGFFLDEERHGKVYIWFHDMDEENELKYLADSFDEFMKGLNDNENY